MFYYHTGERREKFTIYENTVNFPPNSACYFKYNGTRSFIQMLYRSGVTVYFLGGGDPPLFDIDSYDPAQIFFNNSLLIITSSGDLIAERLNYYSFLVVNQGITPVTIDLRLY